MGGLKLAGGLWILGGLSSAMMVFGVIEEPILLILGLGGALTGLTIGALLVARPGPAVLRWSNVAGAAWVIAFGGLTLVEIGMQMGYVSSVARILGFGAAGALVAYLRRAAVASA
jgi:hypothetical protein